MSSSLRNSLHRRNHKERSQLAHRSRLGILEKHKDYVKRARDFHSKQERIKRLREKAAERNKDEFYFGMVKSRTTGGVHTTDRGNSALPIDFVKILKTQDQNYVRAARQANRKKIDNLKAQLTTREDLMQLDNIDDDVNGLNEEEDKILQEAGVLATPSRLTKHKPKHTIFVSDKAEAAKYEAPKSIDASLKKPSGTEREEEESIDLGWNWSDKNSTRKNPSSSRAEETEEDEDSSEIGETGEMGDNVRNSRSRLLKELAARLKRERNLHYVGRELEMQRLLMGKGASRKIRGATLVEGENGKEDEDEIDARRGKRRKPEIGMEPRVYRPRVYKWKAERKK